MTTKRSSCSCGNALTTSSAAPATVADAIERIHQRRGEIVLGNGALEVEDHRAILRLAGVRDDDPFGVAVCPHVEVRDLEPVDTQRRADLGAVIAPVMRELGYEDPWFELDVSRVHAPVGIEVLLGEQ